MSRLIHSLGSVLGAQLRAVLDAEAENARSISDFITSVGFEKKDDQEGIGELRMIQFTMQRRNDAGGLDQHTIKIPLLSILPIPMLSIDKADFEFNLKVYDVKKEKSTGSRSLVPKSAPGVLAVRFGKKRPLPGGTTSGTGTQTVDSNMSVKISVVQTDFPLGVEKLLNLSELGIQDETTT